MIKPVLRNLPANGQFWILLLLFFVCALLFSMIGLAATIPIVGFDGLLHLENYEDPNVVAALKIAQAISAFGMFIVTSMIFTKLVSTNSVDYLSLNKKPLFISFIAVVLLTIVAMPIINWMAEINSHMELPEFLAGLEKWMRQSELNAEQLVKAFFLDTSITGLIINLVIIAVLAAVGEELFFRGCIQRVLIESTHRKHLSIFITAFLFSALHMQFFGFFPRFVLGLGLGYLYAWSGSLWLPITAHFVNNATAVIVSWLIQRGIISVDVEKIGLGKDEYLFTMISALAVSVLLLIIRNSERKKHLTAKSSGKEAHTIEE